MNTPIHPFALNPWAVRKEWFSLCPTLLPLSAVITCIWIVEMLSFTREFPYANELSPTTQYANSFKKNNSIISIKQNQNSFFKIETIVAINFNCNCRSNRNQKCILQQSPKHELQFTLLCSSFDTTQFPTVIDQYCSNVNLSSFMTIVSSTNSFERFAIDVNDIKCKCVIVAHNCRNVCIECSVWIEKD